MPPVADVGDCPLCFGRLLSLSVCQSCNSVVARDGLTEVGPTIVCEDCGATNPMHFVCSACNARFPYSEIVKPEGPTCPVCRNPVPAGAELCPHCSAVLPVAEVAGARPRRRIRGEYGEDDVHEVGRVPGVGRKGAEALCAAGYNALWKIARATEADLARVKGIGAKGAGQIKEALRFLLLVGKKKSKEEVLSEECECPLCGTVTSLFATRCHDCGAEFDDEELDEEFRREVEREEDKGLLAYYDVRLLENPESAGLHYARGLLLLAMTRPTDALAAFDRVVQLEPENPRAMQAKARALGAAKGVGGATQVLKNILAAETGKKPTAPVKEEEVAEAIEALGALAADDVECPECGEKQIPGATVCPVCGHRFPGAPKAEGGKAPRPEISLDEERLLEELERAVAGERAAPPPPLRPEIPAQVVDRKRSMLAFLLKVPGVSRRAAEAVAGFFQDLEQIRLAEVADLADIPGVAPAEGRLIKEAVDRYLGPVEEAVPEAKPVPPRPTPRAAPGIAPPKPAPPPLRPSPPRPAPEVPARRPMELAAGRRGLINGRGLVNGRGRVNGLINGTGFVNGSSLAEMRLPRRNFLPRYIAIGAALIMLFTIAAALVPPSPTSLGIQIDGSFSDWQGVPTYADGTVSGNPSVRITSVSLTAADTTLFLRTTVEQAIFADPTDYDTMYAFLDTDGSNVTGYDLGDLGADYVARVSGSGGQVEDARLMGFDETGRTKDDWSGFTTVTGLTAKASGRDVEVSVPGESMNPYNASALRVRFAFDDNQGETSHTDVPIGTVAGALRVTMTPQTTTLGGGSQPFLSLSFRSLGNVPHRVTRILLDQVGGTVPADLAVDVAVPANGETTYTINADATGLSLGTLVTAAVIGVELASPRPVAIVGPEARAYVGQAPTAKRIDGLFGDWPSPIADDDATPIPRRSLNILSRDGNVSGNQVFLYAKLAGTVLEGGMTPDKPARPPPSGPGNGTQPAPGGPPPPLVGLDYIRFYIDTDAGSPGGFEVGGIFSDAYLEVRGRRGRAIDAGVYRLVGLNWVRESSAAWGLGTDQIELGALLPTATFNGTQFVAISADWSGVLDVASPESTRTRGGPRLVPLDGTNPQTATARPLPSAPTIDGSCTDYAGADIKDNATIRLHVGRFNSRAYFCVEVKNDSDADSGLDWGEVLFDQNHTDGSTPSEDDRRFRKTHGGAFEQQKGQSGVWVNCGDACDSSNAAASSLNNSRLTYEFDISYLDVWGTSNPAPNEPAAGFAFVGYDNSGDDTYWWGSNTVNENTPSSWGLLEIPEFQDLVFVFFAIAGVALSLGRRRRHR